MTDTREPLQREPQGEDGAAEAADTVQRQSLMMGRAGLGHSGGAIRKMAEASGLGKRGCRPRNRHPRRR